MSANVAADAIVEHVPEKLVDYAKTGTLNLISRKSNLQGAQNIVAQGRCIIREQATLRGDVAKIQLGKCCYMHTRATLHPPSFGGGAAGGSGGPAFLPMTVGDHVSIGEGAVVRSASIGSSVVVGRDCTLGERSIVKDCCEILPGSVVANDQVIPPFTQWGGNPAKMVAQLHESFGKRVEFAAEDLFAEQRKFT